MRSGHLLNPIRLFISSGKNAPPASSLSARNSLRRSGPTSYTEPDPEEDGEDDHIYSLNRVHSLEDHADIDLSRGVPPADDIFPSLPSGGRGLGGVAAGDADSMRVD